MGHCDSKPVSTSKSAKCTKLESKEHRPHKPQLQCKLATVYESGKDTECSEEQTSSVYSEDCLPVSMLREKLSLLAVETHTKDFNFDETFEIVKAIMSNIANHFHNPKYRVLKKTNPTFYRYIGQFEEGCKLMKALGFEETKSSFAFSEVLNQSHASTKVQHLQVAYDLIYQVFDKCN